MAKRGNGSTGLVLAAALGLGAFALFRQGQATANALATARLKSFEFKGWNGTTLSALAGVEFNNTSVNRDVQLQDLGLNLTYNDTTLGTAHLANGPLLAANQNTVVPIPVTLNVGSLLTQLALTGKVPALATFTSLTKLATWLSDKIAPETLRLTGTAKVGGVVVDINEAVPLENYLPGPPRQTGAQPLPSRPATARPSANAPVATSVPSTVRPTRVQQVTTTARKVTTTASQAASRVKQAGTFVRDTTAAVTTAVQQARAAGAGRKPRPAKQGKATAGKVRKAVKPPAKQPATKQTPSPTSNQPTYDWDNWGKEKW